MKIISIVSIYLISCLISSADEQLHSAYYENSRSLVSFLKTENKNQIECIRICILNEANQSEVEIYAQSANHNGNNWILNNGAYVTFDVVKNEPVRMLKFETKILNQLPLSCDLLHQRTKEYIIYCPNSQVFRASPFKQQGIHFISHGDSEIQFLAAESYTIKESEDQSASILTFINGSLNVIAETSFKPALQVITFESLDIELPHETLELFNPNHSE